MMYFGSLGEQAVHYSIPDHQRQGVHFAGPGMSVFPPPPPTTTTTHTHRSPSLPPPECRAQVQRYHCLLLIRRCAQPPGAATGRQAGSHWGASAWLLVGKHFCWASPPACLPVRLPARLQPGENAANWMLDVAGGSAAGASTGPDFVELYKVGGVEWYALWCCG